MTKWGLAATILAPTADILRFAAYHIDAGAHRLYLYLDDPDSGAFAPLKAHPKIRVQACDVAHWQKIEGKRPEKHQVRQSRNATHAYNRKVEVDWLIHMDVDEFLVPQTSVSDSLAALNPDTACARTRPMEQLAGVGNSYKIFIPNGPERTRIVQDIYPEFGAYIKGGFLSHVAGKLFVRKGLPDISVRIHNAFQGDAMNPNEIELSDMDLAHAHAKTWEDWITAYRYRLEKGSYRAELAPAQSRKRGGLTLHEMFQTLEAAEGEAGLRRFYTEVATDTDTLRARLQARGMYREITLDLDAKLARHFPDFT